MAHISEKKKKIVGEFSELLNAWPIIGAVNMRGIPAKQLQKMREKLRGKFMLKMTKRRLMKIAFEGAEKDNIKELIPHLKGMPALLFTKDNPFSIYAELEKNKSSAPAKAGQTAPKDIVVRAGTTPFTPGPIIGHLGKLGIKTSVEGGKIAIKEDAVVVKEGETITEDIASILTRLGIEPMEIGLDLVAVYENGTIFTSDVLGFDAGEYLMNIQRSFTQAINLSVYIAYPTKDNITMLLAKSFSDARTLAVSECIVTEETVKELLKKAQAEMTQIMNRTEE